MAIVVDTHNCMASISITGSRTLFHVKFHSRQTSMCSYSTDQNKNHRDTC